MSPALLDRARSLLQQAPLIHTHNDLPSMLLEAHGDLTRFDMGKTQPTLCADIPRLREGWVGVQYLVGICRIGYTKDSHFTA